jgi:hypothetical protein
MGSSDHKAQCEAYHDPKHTDHKVYTYLLKYLGVGPEIQAFQT